MKRTPARGEAVKPAEVPVPIPARNRRKPPKRKGVRYLQVGDVWVPTVATKSETFVVQHDGKPIARTIEGDYSRLPVASVPVPPDIDDQFRQIALPVWKSCKKAIEKHITNEDDGNIAIGLSAYYIANAAEAGFYCALLLFADDLKSSAEMKPTIERLREHAELLAAEGRAAKAANDQRRANLICTLYKAIRPSYPDGNKGNGEAHRAVAERFERIEDRSVTVRTVRDTVTKAGLSAPRRSKRKD